jgi:hypothetical protein
MYVKNVGGDTMADKRTYAYAVEEEGNRKFVRVQNAGRFALADGEDPAKKAKQLVVSTQQVSEDSVEVEKVDGFVDGVITSDQPKQKQQKR